MEEEKKPKRPRIGSIPGASSWSSNEGERHYEKVNYPEHSQNNGEKNYQRPYNSYSTQGYQNRYNNRYQDSEQESEGYDNEHIDNNQYPSYQRTNGYNQNRQGGYNQNRQNYNQGSYRQQGGYGHNRQRNYTQGSYRQQNDYNNYYQNDYRQQTPYSQNRQGGYRQGGYNQHSGGFNRNRQGGYNNYPNFQQKSSVKRRQNNTNKIQKLPRPVDYVFTDIDPTQEIRLNKYLANAGICSRREADELITQGKVTVNGTVVTELGTKITRNDNVEVNDKVITPERKVYILLNKPKNCITTSDDPKGRKTVTDIVKSASEERIYPVGRLDRNTTGVLLLTNDGDLASKLTHPRFVKKKIYHVWTDKPISEEDMQRMADGIILEDGEIHADAISYVSDTDKKQAGIEIHSGRNRIVRRMFKELGYKVLKLDRVYFAGLTKKNLPRGKWRHLSQEEVNFLRMGAFE